MARKKPEEPAQPDWESVAERVGHRFARPELLRQALTHRSAADHRRGQLDSNERLEFIGDRVLGLLMAEWLTERFPDEREGALMRRFGVLVAWDTLAAVAESLDLGAALVVPPGESRAGLTSRRNVLADAMEALLGAVYLDGGLDAARPVLRRAFGPLLEGDERPPLPAKSRLQEWLQGRGLGLPEYRTTATSGPAHQPVFSVAVSAAGREAEGTGDTRRAAEQAAATAWLAGIEAS